MKLLIAIWTPLLIASCTHPIQSPKKPEPPKKEERVTAPPPAYGNKIVQVNKKDVE